MLRSKERDLLLINYNKSLYNLLYELHRWIYLFGHSYGRRDSVRGLLQDGHPNLPGRLDWPKDFPGGY